MQVHLKFKDESGTVTITSARFYVESEYRGSPYIQVTFEGGGVSVFHMNEIVNFGEVVNFCQ